ncbi:hypothetical protein D3C85_848060 [compost metagenome]
MAQVAVEDLHIDLGAGLGAVPPNAAGELDQRAHGRGLDHRPVVVMVAADFGDRRAKHDKQLLRLVEVGQALANVGQREYRIGLLALEGGIQPAFDGRAQQQGKLRVVDAQVNPRACGGTQAKQGEGHIEQRFDIGHAHQAEADPLAAVRIEGGVFAMQLLGGGEHLFGEGLTDFLRTLAGEAQRQ